MAPRIPSTKTLEAELISTVSGIYNSEARHELSVNLVRQRVESKLGLKDGFFKEEDWKSKSKEIIKNTVVSSCPSKKSTASICPAFRVLPKLCPANPGPIRIR